MNLPEWWVGEIFEIDGELMLCVGIDEERAALMHRFSPTEKVLINMELGEPHPFRGNVPGVWLKRRMEQLVN